MFCCVCVAVVANHLHCIASICTHAREAGGINWLSGVGVSSIEIDGVDMLNKIKD